MYFPKHFSLTRRIQKDLVKDNSRLKGLFVTSNTYK